MTTSAKQPRLASAAAFYDAGRLLESLPDIVWAADRDGNTVAMSAGIEQLIGVSAEAIVAGGTALRRSLMHPDDLPRVAEAYARLFEEGLPYDIEYRLRRSDGEWLWVQSRAAHVYEQDGRRLAAGILVDFTERHHAAEQQVTLADFGVAALDYHDPQKLIADACEIVCRLTNCDETGVLVYDAALGSFVPQHGVRWLQPGETVPDVPDRIAGYVRRSGVPFVYGEAAEERRVDVSRLTQAGFRSGAVALIGPVEKPLGVLGAHSRRPHTFGPRDAALIRSVANIIAAVAVRHEVESDLRSARELYESVARAAQEGIVTVDRLGILQFVNNRFAEMIGTKPEELIGQDLADLAIAEDRPTMLARRVARMRGESSKYDVRLRRVDGEVIWVSVAANPITGRDGNVGAMGVLSDITHRVKAAELLARQKQQLAEAQSIAHVGSWDIDMSVGTVTWSDEMFRIAGLEPDGRPVPIDFVGTLFPGGSAEADALMQMIASQDDFDLVHEFLRPDGSRRWIRSRGRKSGEQHVVGTSQDITSEKLAEKAREALEALLRNAAAEWKGTFDSIPSPVLIVDDARRVQRLNGAALAISDCASFQEAIGLPISRLGSQSLWPELLRIAESCVRRGDAVAERVDTAEGKHWDVVASRWSIEDQSRVTIFTADVTSIVQLADSLRRSERMSAVGSLVAGVAHEVRNPLFGISAALDAIEATGGREALGPFTVGLRKQVTRLNELMFDLLEYGKPAPAVFRNEQLDVILHDAISSTAALASHAGVEVAISLPDPVPVVSADRRRLLQVFENVLRNAIQHSRRDQKVEMTARVGESFVVVTVEDRGEGFGAQDLTRIFEPFYTRRRGGTGLGLSLAQRIIEEHGGVIAASDREGGGAALTVTLPLVHGDRQ